MNMLPRIYVHPDDEKWMVHALCLAQQGALKGEVPVAAIIVYQNKIIGCAYNQPIMQHDPSAHAEIMAIRAACKYLKNYRLPDGCTMYITLEPCTMCVGTLIHARLQHLVFAAKEPRFGALVSAQQLLTTGLYNHYFTFKGNVLAQSSISLLKSFFKMRRKSLK